MAFIICMSMIAPITASVLAGFKLPDALKKDKPAVEIPYVVPAPVIDTLAASFYKIMIIEKARKENRLLENDSEIYKQVERVFKNLEQAAMRSKYGKTAKDIEKKWELNVIKDDEVKNAFAWPGGKIAVYTGILTFCKNKGGLSAVLGHEMIHALARHAAQRINKDVIASLPIASLAAGTALDPKKLNPEVVIPIMAGLGMGVAVGVDLPFARENEFEADYEGLLLAANAGYDPKEAILFWTRLFNKEKTGIEYLSAHPSHGERFKKLNSHMDEFQGIYNKAKEKQKSMEPLVGVSTGS